MNRMPSALGRCLAIFGLAVLIVLLTPIAWIAVLMSGVSLGAVEWARAELKRLRGAV